MSNAIQLYENGGFDIMQRAAAAFADSGYFADAKQTAQALAKIAAGAEMGIAPFASMTGIHVIKGVCGKGEGEGGFLRGRLVCH